MEDHADDFDLLKRRWVHEAVALASLGGQILQLLASQSKGMPEGSTSMDAVCSN